MITEQHVPASTTHSHENADWQTPWQTVAKRFRVDVEQGLDAAEVRRRFEIHGPNRLREHKPQSLFAILVRQFKSLIVALLAAAAAVAFAFGDQMEGWAVVAVIVLNASIGFVVEWRAIRSMEALYGLTRVQARVRRDGVLQQLPADEIVPGDVLHVEGGDVIPADLRIVKGSRLQADESALTGESLPVDKGTEPVDESAPLAERASMLYKGTFASRGSGEGIVVATGMDTELGTITSLVIEAEDEKTPLEKRLEQLGRKLIMATLGIVTLVAVAGIATGKPLVLMIQTGISLAVAAIPEGLPIVATLALARGVRSMARRNALVNRLAAVETLGATSVIFTDKTGTLTENKMSVTHLVVHGEEVDIESVASGDGAVFAETLQKLLEVGVLCNTAREGAADGEGAFGDPLEVALLEAGRRAGIDPDEVNAAFPEVREEAFDPDVKLMATFHRSGDTFRVAVKGAPEEVLAASATARTAAGAVEMTADEKRRWLERNEELASQGLRVIAFAEKQTTDRESEPYQALEFLGLAGLSDPPRPDVRPAIDQCKAAGIQVVMLTGDQPATALRIGRLTGITDDDKDVVVAGSALPDRLGDAGESKLLDVSIFARVSPRQKLDLIELHQKHGRIVAMTGDGVNDAPGLKKADIGIAMGMRGTEVAREAADMVLQDDAFGTIVEAVRYGRIIFGNIRRFAFYLMSCNVSEVMVVGLAAALGTALPILPLQILFLNLVTDVFPALALGVGRGDRTVLSYPPRDPTEPFLHRRHWVGIVGYGVVFSISVLGALWIALLVLQRPVEQAVSISFLTLAFAQLWHVFNMRSRGSGVFVNDVTRNPFVWTALGFCVLLVLVATYTPSLAEILRIHAPDRSGWLIVLGMSILPLIGGQFAKIVAGWRKRM